MGIPLPALALQQPQQQDPMAQYAKLAQLKGLMQQQSTQQQIAPSEIQGAQANAQIAQTEAQKQALSLKSQQGISQALVDAKGDKDQFLSNVQNPKYGVLPSDQFGLQHKYVEMQKTMADADSATLTAQHAANEQLVQHLSNVMSVPPEDKQAQWTLERNAIMRNPTLSKYAQQIPPQYPGDQQAEVLENGMKMSSQILAEQKQKNEASGQIATSQKEQQEAAMTPEQRAALSSPEVASQQAWLAKNPGKDASDYQIMMKKLIPAYNFNLQGGQGGGLNDAALDQAAQRYAQTGTLPAMGMGTAGAAARKAIMNRAGILSPNGSIAANSAEYAANENSLKGLQKNFDQVTAFENTAGKNLDQFLSTAKSVVDSDSPLVNQPLRFIAGKVAGSPQQAAFDAARTTALTEISKVLNSSNASGVLSDSARNEVSQLVGPNATLKQIYSAANILKTDMGNRHDAYQEQIADIQKRLGGTGSSGGQSNQNNADPFAQFGGKAHPNQ